MTWIDILFVKIAFGGRLESSRDLPRSARRSLGPFGPAGFLASLNLNPILQELNHYPTGSILAA